MTSESGQIHDIIVEINWKGCVTMSDMFLTLYPGIYLPEEKRAMERYRARLDQLNFTPTPTVPDILAGKVAAEDNPGIPPVQQVTLQAAQTMARQYDPENPLYFDEDYAAASPYGGLIAMPVFPCPKGGFFGGLTDDFGDIKSVREHHHYVEFFAPIYVGDTLYTVVENRDFTDITPATGSKYRTWALRGTGKVYNQHGELVMIQTCGAKECFQIYADPEKRTWDKEMETIDWSDHIIHHYTDQDWDTIRNYWSKEYRRGSTPLYWEDVQVGDRPPVTIDGPFTTPDRSPLCCGPSQSDWALRSCFGAPENRRDEFGQYHVPAAEEAQLQQQREQMAQRPPRKPGPAPKKPLGGNSPFEIRGRASLENYTGRNTALRAIMNYIGDAGRICRLSWAIGTQDETHLGIPAHPNRVSSFKNVPGMETCRADIHGEAGDVAINRIVVTGKYQENDGFFVELTWWCETLDGQIFTEGTATVQLPSKNGG